MKLTVMLMTGLLALAGCASMGPKTVARDRFDYVDAISDSWKQQMLLNLLKVRYADVPVFLEVTSVISSYEIHGALSAFGQEAPQGRAGDSFVGMSANGSYTDRPTITYAPMSSDKFAKSLMAPFPITGVALLMQAGYPPDTVLSVCANSINGISNRYGGRSERRGDPRYHELLTLLRAAQDDGDLAMYAEKDHDVQRVKLTLRRGGADSESRNRRIAALLGHDGEGRDFEVIYGARQVGKNEIVIQTRSMMQVLVDLSSYIEVPARDLAEGRVYAPPRDAESDRLFPAALRIRSTDSPPDDAYIAVRYRDGWFYIDDRDHASKSAFNALMLLFSLTETGAPAAAPIVTVPVR